MFNFNPTLYDYEIKKYVHKLFKKSIYEYKNEMTDTETAILMGLIKEYDIKNVVEIGVAEGGSSCCILQALNNKQNGNLYSIDKDVNCYTNPKLKEGYLTEEFKSFSNLQVSHYTYYGKCLIDVIDKLPNNIDLCIIDAEHLMPDDLLNTILILNKLHEGSIIYYHDTIEFTTRHFNCDNLPSSSMITLLSISGEKYIPSNINCGVVYCNKDTFKNIDNLFYALLLQFHVYNEQFLIKVKQYLDIHYPKYKQFVTDVFNTQKKIRKL